MITKLAELYYSGNDVVGNKNVRGYNTGILEIVVSEGQSTTFGVYVTKDGTVATSSSPRADVYEGTTKITKNKIISTPGTYRFLIDLTGVTNCYITASNVAELTNVTLNYKQTEFVVPKAKAEQNFQKIVSGSLSKVDVSNFNSAKIEVTVTDTPVTFSARVDSSAEYGKLYNGGFIISGNVTLSKSGKYVYDLDLTTATSLTIQGTNVSSSTIKLFLSSEMPQIDATKPAEFKETTTLDVSNTNSIKLRVKASDVTGSSYLRIYNENSVGVFVDNGEKIWPGYAFLSNGINNFLVDCTSANTLEFALVTPSDSTATYDAEVYYSDEIVDANKYIKQGWLQATDDVIELESGTKQIEFDVTGDSRILVEGSNDDFSNSTFIVLYIEGTNAVVYQDYLQVTSTKQHVFANVEGYSKVRIRNVNNKISKIDNMVCHKTYVEGKKIIKKNPSYGGSLFKGYKWFKINFLKSAIINGTETQSSVIGCSSAVRFGSLPYTSLKFYDSGMNPYPSMYIDKTYGLILQGTPAGGGFIVETPEPLDGTVNIYNSHLTSAQSITGYAANALFEVECYTEKPIGEPNPLKKMYEHEDYDVYKLPSDNTNRDVLNHDVLEWEDNSITFWYNGYLGIKYEMPFTADNVAHFVTGEKINFAYLLPFAGNTARNNEVATDYALSRIVVFTDSRVFHNYPVRKEDSIVKNPASDCLLFDESAVYNFRDKVWNPVNDKTKVDSNHIYLPVLKDYDYNQFDGRISGTTGFVDTYGNGGLPTDKRLQDIPIAGIQFWSRLRYSNMTKGPKWCTFGNYNMFDGAEPLVMSTNNGGRTWYTQAYFCLTDDYNYCRGSRIDLTPINDVAAYVSGSLKMCRRRYNVPTAETKEPDTPFIIDSNDEALVSSFTYDSDGNCLVNLSSELDYDGVYPVVFFKNISANSEWDYICNNVTAKGTNNTQIFFRVQKISTTQYKLFADIGNVVGTDMVCRHIHAVNSFVSGVIISTGESYSSESYEGGFLYCIEGVSRNGGHAVTPNARYKVNRLCSSMEGVNRCCGAFLFSDNADPTLLYVSDETFAIGSNHKRFASIPGRTTEIPIYPGGVFVGKLSDIDDQRKFKNVCEIQTTIVGLLESHGHFAADGHSNSVCFSKDGFRWNIDVHDKSSINGADNLGNIYFGDKVAVFK